MQEAALKKAIALVFALTLLSAAAAAQIPSAGNLYLGYSYLRADTSLDNRGDLHGWDATLEGKLFPFVGLVADVGANYGTLYIPVAGGSEASSTRITNYLFGPRVSAPAGPIRPFVQALFGASHVHESNYYFEDSDTQYAHALGGGADIHLAPRLSWRLQGDYLQTRYFGSHQDNFRFTTGVALKF